MDPEEMIDRLRDGAQPGDEFDLLRSPVEVLIGVPASALPSLKSLGVVSVFDLGASWVFANAVKVARASSERRRSTVASLVAADLLVSSAADVPQHELALLPINSLRGLETVGASLATALDVESIRELSAWPPFRFAHDLVGSSTGGTVGAEPGDELRPRLGEFPTERIFYDSLVMFETSVETSALTELDEVLDLSASLAAASAVQRPSVGALITYSQSWYTVGVTLGHLLHSLALAPGEATRIAVIDWTRRTSASTSESIAESDQLDNSTNHARALSEVQRAVANELQQGGSDVQNSSKSGSSASAEANSSGLLASLFWSGSGSSSSQSAWSDSSASSTSWSMGHRDVMGRMNQNINDRTQQHASSVRNRRASAVREVSQSEHESVSTRIVANYNHMHALTVQYYEVVQAYQVTTRVERADRVLFLPVGLLEFDSDVIDRYRGALTRAALTPKAVELLTDDATSVAVTPERRDLYEQLFEARNTIALKRQADPVLVRSMTQGVSAAIAHLGDGKSELAMKSLADLATAEGEQAHVVAYTRNDLRMQVQAAAKAIGRPVLRPSSASFHFPDDTDLIGVRLSGVSGATELRLDRPGVEDDGTVSIADPGWIDAGSVPLASLEAIQLVTGAPFEGTITLVMSYLGRRFESPAMPIKGPAGGALVLRLASDREDRKKQLTAHLRANQAHYTQAVLSSIDATTVVQLLGKYKWNGVPLLSVVEPKVIAVCGNMIVLKAPVNVEDPSGVDADGKPMTWAELLADRYVFTAEDERLIPLPTNGVFAEAVLGRSNSAEKLDITRFWNWEDSPIPLLPPEIAPVTTGSRATVENLTTGQLGAPTVSIVSPVSLPDPSGVGSILGAVASGSMFRDMSGLAGNQAAAQALGAATLTAATDAGGLATENLKAEAQKAVEMGKIGADIAKTAITAGAGAAVPSDGKSSGPSRNISSEGARINHGRDLDARAGSAGAAAGSGGAGQGTGGPGSGSSGGSGGSSGGGTDGSIGAAAGEAVGAAAYEATATEQGTLGYSPTAVKKLQQSTTQPLKKAALESGETGGDAAGGSWRPPPGISSIRFWINAFIPGSVPGKTFVVPAGPYKGWGALRGPIPGISDAFLTDNRTFSSSIAASSRLHSEVEILIDRAAPSIIQRHVCGESVEIDDDTGDVEGRATASTSRMSFHNLRVVTPTVLSFQVRSAANNPLFTASPDIDFDGTIIVDLTAMTFTFDGKIDEFPAFEGYITRDGSGPVTLFNEPPHPGADPSNLFGGPNRPVGRSVPIPAKP